MSRHMTIATVKGRFRDFDGAIVFGEISRIAWSIRAASLETLDTRRDEHLRSPDFFDVERFPEITFEANGVELNGDGERSLVPGELTIKGVRRPVLLDGVFRGAAVHRLPPQHTTATANEQGALQ